MSLHLYHSASRACTMRRCFVLRHGVWQLRRRYGTDAAPRFSEDRMANWCRRLWALGQGSGGTNAPRNESALWNAGVAACAQELHTELRLVEELKTALIGEKGRLPPSVVAAVWHVYESIIPPSALCDLADHVSASQETAFFSFVGLLTELDVNMVEVQSTAAQLNQTIEIIGSLHEQLRNSDRSVAECRSTLTGVTEDSALDVMDRTAISAKLEKAKNNLLRQCVSMLHAGSPFYYTWLMQSASLERGVRRLMDLRRCVAHFLERCRSQLALLQGELKQQSDSQREQLFDATNPLRNKEQQEVWLARQRHLLSIDCALEYLFSDFFSKQWLIMEELTWHTTPPSLLEKVMDAERVHPFTGGLVDLKRRLQPTRDRHLFAFFHPAVVEEPLIAVQVALTCGIARSIDIILGRPHLPGVEQTPPRPGCAGEENVDTATFYSINSAQSALRGVNLGNLLIKRVVCEIETRLNAERCSAGLSAIKTFCTLSPIPGYMNWLVSEVAKFRQRLLSCGDVGSSVPPGKFAQHRIFGECSAVEAQVMFSRLRNAVVSFLDRNNALRVHLAAEYEQLHSLDADSSNLATLQILLSIFQLPDKCGEGTGPGPSCGAYDDYHWWCDEEFARALEKPLLRSVAHYLGREKRRPRILDPVGNFHVSNGAMIFRLNFLANCTPSGSRESATVMVNYLYETSCVNERLRAYEMQRSVSMGEDILQNLGSS
uniref:Putative malonyl-CoA decarboxylase, mitochondrial n=1 Tax=Trypanosoma congolense (strain IL3000) TaxID=1068625 RepID=G0UR46_TRYCI|nr:putative malonyl-CoA decarboxylase, mitochondrial precursor [Trypanosoma congolense IL3000]